MVLGFPQSCIGKTLHLDMMRVVNKPVEDAVCQLGSALRSSNFGRAQVSRLIVILLDALH
jgi:hypothetical protein